MRNLKQLKKVLLIVLMINLVLMCFGISKVKAEEPEQGNEGEIINEEVKPEARQVENGGENQGDGENQLEGENQGGNEGQNPEEGEIDLSGVTNIEELLGGMQGENQENNENQGPTNAIARVDITAHLNKDGSAAITEVWQTNMQTGSEMTRIYTDFSSYSIKDLSVKDETTGRQYTYVDSWNTLTGKENRDDKCGVVNLGSVVNICWGIGEYGEHKYIVRYTITDFVKDYSSYQLVYLKMLQDNMDPVPGKAKVMVYSDFDLTEDNVSINGYGFIGKTEFQNGYAVYETSGSLEKVGYMTVFLKFSGSPFDAKPALVLDLEAIRSNPNNLVSNQENTEEEKKLSTGAIVGIVIGIIAGIAVIVVVVVVIMKKRKLEKKRAAKKAREAKEAAGNTEQKEEKDNKETPREQKDKKEKDQKEKEKKQEDKKEKKNKK